MLLDVRGASTAPCCPTIDAYAIVLDDDGDDGARVELRLLNMIGDADRAQVPVSNV